MRATIMALLVASSIAEARPRVARNDDRPSSHKEEEDDESRPEVDAVLPMKLDDLIEVAIRLSPDANKAKIDRQVAKYGAEGERRSQAWKLFTNGEWKRTATAESKVEAFARIYEEKLTVGVGVNRNLPTGGNVQIETGVMRSEQEYLIDTAKLTQQAPAGMDPYGRALDLLLKTTGFLRGTLKQPLIRGFGPKVALAPIAKADLAATAETVKAQLKTEELLKEVVQGYWDLALASFTVDVRAQALELAESQEKLTREQIRAGTAADTAVNAVIYEIAMRKDSLLKAQRELENKSLELRRKVGLEIGRRDIALKPSEPFVIGDDEFDVDELLERARMTNRKLATIQLQKKIADIEVAVARDQTRPQLDLQFQGAIMGEGDSATNAVGSIGGVDGYEVMVNLHLEFEISGAAGKARDAALAKRKKVDFDRADAERQIEVQVVNAVHAVSAARTRVGLSDKAIMVAEENARTSRAEFMMNRTNNFQVMERQTQLVDARLRRGQAVTEYHKAVAELQFLSGLLLDQYRVNVKPRGERR